MDLYGSSLVLVADGGRARLFEERRRGGPLIEITQQLGDLAAHGPRRPGFRGRAHSRAWRASHAAGDPNPTDVREGAFVGRLAARLAEIAGRGDYDGVVLFASPRALGELRRSLPPAVHIAETDPHDRVSLGVQALRTALHDLRLRTVR
ncbi:MAG: host attachment protein [Caulobacterales bacterium]|nr:host attachment protein [Caulobacterales bacterium]